MGGRGGSQREERGKEREEREYRRYPYLPTFSAQNRRRTRSPVEGTFLSWEEG